MAWDTLIVKYISFGGSAQTPLEISWEGNFRTYPVICKSSWLYNLSRSQLEPSSVCVWHLMIASPHLIKFRSKSDLRVGVEPRGSSGISEESQTHIGRLSRVSASLVTCRMSWVVFVVGGGHTNQRGSLDVFFCCALCLSMRVSPSIRRVRLPTTLLQAPSPRESHNKVACRHLLRSFRHRG
ncbi:unnamed protein product [Hapterophycus canaliculatus]